MPRLLKALEFRQTASFHMLLLARNLLIDGEATYLGFASGAAGEQMEWGSEDISRNAECTTIFSAGGDSANQTGCRGGGETNGVDGRSSKDDREPVFPGSGLVSHEQFRELEKTLPKVKEEFAKMHAQSEEEKVELNHAWPFDVADRGERSAQAEEE